MEMRTIPDSGTVFGVAEIGLIKLGNATRLSHLYQHNPLRVLFPTPEPGDALLAVLVTTSGGLVAGDRIRIEVRVGPGAIGHVTAAAAEKAYRSIGRTTEIAQFISVERGAWLEFLPQETILFDGARLSRHLTVELGPGSGFLGGSIIAFGRRAGGEHFTQGRCSDNLEVHCAGRLVWGDSLRLSGNVPALMQHPACFGGAAACATLVLAPPAGDPRKYIDAARAVQQRDSADGLISGITAVNGVLVARWLSADLLPLRRAFAELACYFRHAAMGLPARLPRLWHV